MEKNLICYFQKGDSPGSLNLWTIDIETKLKINKYSYEILSENVLNYFKNIPEFIKNFAKAVIFKQLTDFENLSFKNSSEFVRLIKSEFKKLNIPIRFIGGGTFSLTTLLIAAKINPKFDRNILFILVADGRIFVEELYRIKEEQKEAEIVQIYPILKKQCHKIKLTLTIDINLKPALTQTAYIEPKIKSLPKTLNKIMDLKIPVIGFFDNSSIICFWNEKEKCYKFSEKWNGLYGEDLYISFDKEKPKFRNEAFKVLKEKPTFVVYDLLDILASKIDNFHTRPYWQFSITKDEENPILIEFDNFDGSRKHAIPELLLALLIKDHLKVIKEEIGEKPAEIGVVFVDKYKNEKYFDHSLLLERIEESCNLLKIDCKIVEI